MKKILDWQKDKWQPPPGDQELADITSLTFGTESGQRWLNYMLDNVYCTVIATNDPYALAAHNGQRALIHDILQKIDQSANPKKYQGKPIDDTPNDPRL